MNHLILDDHLQIWLTCEHVAKFGEFRAATTEFSVRKRTAAKQARSLINTITAHKGLYQPLIYAQHIEKKESK